MTHHTEAERAEFEIVASDNGKWPKAIERNPKGDYILMATAVGWTWWQAARRAPAAPVPQDVIDALDRMDALLKPELRLLAVGDESATAQASRRDMATIRAAALAAAPQPPEVAPQVFSHMETRPKTGSSMRAVAVDTMGREMPNYDPLAAPVQCWCETCRPQTLDDMRFIVCPDCGNKRCPKANNHANACTNNNAPGQKGSSWENVKPFVQSPAPIPPEAAPEDGFELWRADHMPNATQTEAWAAWVALDQPAHNITS